MVMSLRRVRGEVALDGKAWIKCKEFMNDFQCQNQSHFIPPSLFIFSATSPCLPSIFTVQPLNPTQIVF
jgi:hypothetical protein